MQRSTGLTITVPVATLEKKLAENRKHHFAEYTKAKKGWKKVLRKQLDGLLFDLETDVSIEDKRLYLERKPTHYLAEYDEALEMLSWTTSADIELDQNQFRAYINNEWVWKDQWSASNSTYIAAAAG